MAPAEPSLWIPTLAIYALVIGTELLPIPCPYSLISEGNILRRVEYDWNGNGMMCGVGLSDWNWMGMEICQWRILWIPNWLKGQQIKGPFMFLYLFRFDLFCDWEKQKIDILRLFNSRIITEGFHEFYLNKKRHIQ